MGQAEVQQVLMRNRRRWITSDEIKEQIAANTSKNIQRALGKMMKFKEVKKKRIKSNLYVYKLMSDY